MKARDEEHPRSSRKRYRLFVQDYKHGRLDEAAEKDPARRPGAAPPGTPKPDEVRRGKRREYLREYLRWLWPHRYAVGLVFFLALVTGGLEMIEPLFMRFIIDRVLLNTALDAADAAARGCTSPARAFLARDRPLEPGRRVQGLPPAAAQRHA